MKARIRNAIGPYEDLLTSLKRRKLKWYGYVTRSSGLAKTWNSSRRETKRQTDETMGRQHQRVTGLEWNTIPRKEENREEWRKLVVKSTVVPERSARLRDR